MADRGRTVTDGFGVRTLAVWSPDWPLVAGGLVAVPAAVVHSGRVTATSPPARAEGVRRGQRRRQAQACCSGLVVVPHDPARDVRLFEQVVSAVAAFTPRVEVTRPGVCSFPARGPARYFGGEEALAAKVTAAAGETVRAVAGEAAGAARVACRVGIADGPFSAGFAARTGVIVGRGRSGEFLGPFPVSALERPELASILGRLGVRTLAELGALPEEAVAARFGADGRLAHRLARGLDDRSLVLRDPPVDLAVRRELDPPADRVETVAFAAVGLAEELCGRIASAGLACTRLRIEAETEDGETVSRIWRGDRPFGSRSIVDRVRWQLEGWVATGGIAMLRLVVEEAVRGAGRQLGFSGEVGEADLRAERGLARVQGLLGHEAVLTAVVGGGRGPGDQVSFVPWGTVPPAARTPPAASTPPAARTAPAAPGRTPPWPGRLPPPAPAVVHPIAIPVEVVDCSHLPVRVTGRGQLSGAPDLLLGVLEVDAASVASIREGKVAGWAGPWLADERWWDLRLRRRRARMQVLLDDGSAHLLVLEGGRWGVEATYD